MWYHIIIINHPYSPNEFDWIWLALSSSSALPLGAGSACQKTPGQYDPRTSRDPSPLRTKNERSHLWNPLNHDSTCLDMRLVPQDSKCFNGQNEPRPIKAPWPSPWLFHRAHPQPFTGSQHEPAGRTQTIQDHPKNPKPSKLSESTQVISQIWINIYQNDSKCLALSWTGGKKFEMHGSPHNWLWNFSSHNVCTGGVTPLTTNFMGFLWSRQTKIYQNISCFFKHIWANVHVCSSIMYANGGVHPVPSSWWFLTE